jgi:transposase InsO family protein
VHAELTLGRRIAVGLHAVELLMQRAALQGVCGRSRYHRIPNGPTAEDMVDRQFQRTEPNWLWVTDITEHPPRPLTSTYAPCKKPVLLRSIEPGQFTPWAFTQRAIDSGLVPSMGSIGDCFDNAVIESFWSRLQVELLDRKRWRTRIELATAIFEYLVFHNRQRRHSAPGMLTPVEFEARHKTGAAA